tara:strand:- start:2724 stop:2966 length:243 start_codon:yes stop_codon:yes gene_type:complete
MFGNMPNEVREMGSLKLKVGDLVEMNPAAMLNGAGLAIVTAVDEKIEGLHEVRYLKNDYEITADDMLDILRVVSRAGEEK